MIRSRIELVVGAAVADATGRVGWSSDIAKLMRYSIVLVTLLLSFVGLAAAQETDAERKGLRGRVKYFVQYETYFCCSPNQRMRLPRRLTGTTKFNKNGGCIEWISINNTSDGPYYTRRVFKYDERGRKIGAEEYRSDKNPPEIYFELVRTADGSVKLKPERTERLVERTSYTLDGKGRIVEVISRDHNENLIFHHIFRLDRTGRTVRMASIGEGGVVKSDSATLYFDNGETAETLGFDQQGNVTRSVIRYDRDRRVMGGQRYTLEADPTGKGSRYVSQNTATYAYKYGGEWSVDSIRYGRDGTPEWKTVTTYSGRDEVLGREEFTAGPLPAGSQNEDIEPAWTMRERTLYRREYDRKGNTVRSEIRQQCGPDAPLELTNIYDHVITYY